MQIPQQVEYSIYVSPDLGIHPYRGTCQIAKGRHQHSNLPHTAFCTTFPSGQLRNVAFATFGGGSPLGFAMGIVLGGVFVDYASWRTAY